MALIDGLISYWKLNEVSGSRADSHGTNALTDNNTVASAAGKIGNCAVFNAASNESLSVADNASFNVNAFTFAGWFQLVNWEAGFEAILSKWTNDSNAEFGLFPDGTGLAFWVWQTQTVIREVSLAATLANNTWFFVVVWYDPATTSINIQLNNGTPATATTSGFTTRYQASTATFMLGDVAGSDLANLNGRLDEWGFWNRVLTSTERTELYNGGAGVTYEDLAGGGSESKSVTDSGAGSDSIAHLGVSVGISDSGAGNDSVPGGSAEAVVSEAGAGVDSIANILASLGIDDSGQGTDAAAIGATLIVTDTGSGEDALSLITFILKQIADAGAGADALAIQVGTLQILDAGAGDDVASVLAQMQIADSGTGLDGVLSSVLIALQDAGTGMDALGPVSIHLQVADLAQAADVLSQLAAVLQVADMGTGIDTAVAFNANVRILSITFSLTRRTIAFSLAKRSITFALNQ
jgi:hypothetical protein